MTVCGRRSGDACAGPLREGDAVGVSLASGDIRHGATVTITHIDGDRVYPSVTRSTISGPRNSR